MMATRALRVAAVLAAGALLAAVIGYWTWQLAAPAPVHVRPAPPDDAVAAIVAGELFGAAGVPSSPADAPASDSIGAVKLLGVMAGRDGRGHALFRVPAGPRLVAVGEEIEPGLRLSSVRNDGVGVRDGGVERTLSLRPAAGARAPPAAPVAAGTPLRTASAPDPARLNLAPAGPKCQPPVGFRGEVVRLNVELVGGLITQPEVWRSMVEPSAGALVVRETAGFGQMVGLQQGDRIEQANGIALTIPEDVVGAVLRPLAANQPVRLSGKRNGAPRELWIANAGCGG